MTGDDGAHGGTSAVDTLAAPPAAPARGRRTRRRDERRRRRRRTASRGAVAAILVVAVVVAVAVSVPGVRRLAARLGAGATTAGGSPAEEAGVADQDPQPTVVLATFDDTDPSAGASHIAILAYDRATAISTILLVPAATVAEVPGHGLLPVGRAYGFGRGPLLDTALDNLLGVDLDHVVGVSRQGWAALFERTGGLRVAVEERLEVALPDGGRAVRFRPGDQRLDGPRTAELLTLRQPGESQLESLTRVQTVLVGLVDAVAADPGVLDDVFSDGAPMLQTPSPEAVREALALLADSRRDDRLTTFTLPVTPIGSGGEDSFRIDEGRAGELIADRLAASVPDTSALAATRLQVLNGNGAPGIGQDVAELLVPAGYRVVLTGNADRFDHAETLVVVYDDDDELLAEAERIRELLGTGRVEVSGTPQSVVDITIVVGRDFGPAS